MPEAQPPPCCEACSHSVHAGALKPDRLLTEGLKEDISFLFSVELHCGQITSSVELTDLCRTSNFVLHLVHLYSNRGIGSP